MRPEPDPGSPADWLRHARSDLAYAMAPRPPEGLLETACFHAQQAAEKGLKALLVSFNVPTLRTHNIKTLLEHLPSTISVPDAIKDTAVLTDYAVATRYPSHTEPVDEDEYLQ